MDIIEMTRSLGHAIQQEESFKKLMKAQNACDNDPVLQDMIGEFNLKRMNLSNASNGENVDQEKISRLNIELRDCYDDIMENANMVAYNEAKDEFDAVMQRITAILQASAQGEDPDTADVQPSCSGNCASCGGCH
ncbi:MAG: YlbF family regulator [Clostridia bacterium]|nr:YlbF family regulator [Clostridia bacterium]MDY5558955.1 YlbF family regulator [Candidatus Heritagella sp.]